MRSRIVEQREQRLARQIEVLLAQEDKLDRRREEIRQREDRVEKRLGELERRRKEVDLEAAKRLSQISELEVQLEQRERALETRERALEHTVRQRARALAQETVSLAERNKLVSRREAVVNARTEPGDPTLDEPAAANDPAEETAEARPSRVPVPEGGWNLNRLERLIEDRASAHPTRIDEWRYYIIYLREFADLGGSLPRSFDWLVYDAFAELIEPLEPANSAA
jgi:hypothetical protein